MGILGISLDSSIGIGNDFLCSSRLPFKKQNRIMFKLNTHTSDPIRLLQHRYVVSKIKVLKSQNIKITEGSIELPWYCNTKKLKRIMIHLFSMVMAIC